MKNTNLGKTKFGDEPSRIHDNLYLSAPPETVKNSYVQASHIILNHFTTLSEEFGSYEPKDLGLGTKTIVDIGCATGDFVAFLDMKFPGQNCYGIDYHSELIDSASTKYPHLRFLQGSILDSSALKMQSVDVLTVIGVLSMFDDVEPALVNLLSWLRPGGLLIILNCFNPYPIDSWMRFERLDEGLGPEVGWNIPSQEKVRRILKMAGAISINFQEFVVDFDRAPREDDPMRSWTVNVNGKKMFLNGLWILHPFSFLVARKR